MATLHQHLRAAERDSFFNFFVEFVKRDDVGIVIFFHAIKRTKLAIDIADVRVIDIAVNDVGDDLIAAAELKSFAFANCRRRSASAPSSSSGKW